MVAAWLENLSQSPLMVMILIQCFFLTVGTCSWGKPLLSHHHDADLPSETHVGMGFDPLVYGVVLIINLIMRLRYSADGRRHYTASRIV